MEIKSIVERQREFFATDRTKDLSFRLEALQKLQTAVRTRERELLDALHADLNKSDMEGYMTEIGMVLEELRYCIHHLPHWSRPRSVRTPLAQFPAKSFILSEPYGVALIMAPWNYPVQLCLVPLAGALMAGNCAVVKPSAYTPNTSAALARILSDTFPPEYVAVVEGGREQNTALLQQRFDYIFFTGSVEVGKLVMESAARNLTPVTLELGGKSPCIVDKSADLPLAARRIAFGKFLNAGQTCVAPDYLLVHESVKEPLLREITHCLEEFYPQGDFHQMPVIVNQKHFQRLCGLMQSGTIVRGGHSDPERRWIEPTILTEVTWDSPIMQEEIFGPLLPVLTFHDLSEVVEQVRAHEKPLALYLFAEDTAVQKEILRRLSFGGGCINDTIIHLATSHMGFGGVGASGMGCYHGKRSFETFSHQKSIVRKATWLDLRTRYLPYDERKLSLVRRLMK